MIFLAVGNQEEIGMIFDCLIMVYLCAWKEPALTTTTSRSNPFHLTVALSTEGWAQGELYWDDGESLDTYERGDYSHILFSAKEVGLRPNLLP